MKTTKEKIVRLFIIYVIAMIYPMFKGFQASSIIPVSDVALISGAIVLVIGLLNNISRTGAFDATAYILKRNFEHYNKTYDAYRKDIEEKQKGSFNYPLYLGILLIITAIIISLFC